jgi:hypothetical protein
MLDGASCAVTGTPIISSGRLASGGRVAATKPMLKWDGLARSALAAVADRRDVSRRHVTIHVTIAVARGELDASGGG